MYFNIKTKKYVTVYYYRHKDYNLLLPYSGVNFRWSAINGVFKLIYYSILNKEVWLKTINKTPGRKIHTFIIHCR